jgi:uncharacterized protein YebE (UPF0316 family)
MSKTKETNERFIYGYFRLIKNDLDIELARVYYRINTQNGEMDFLQTTRLGDGGYGLIDFPLRGEEAEKLVTYFSKKHEIEDARQVMENAREVIKEGTILEKEVRQIGCNPLF